MTGADGSANISDVNEKGKSDKVKTEVINFNLRVHLERWHYHNAECSENRQNKRKMRLY